MRVEVDLLVGKTGTIRRGRVTDSSEVFVIELNIIQMFLNEFLNIDRAIILSNVCDINSTIVNA